MRREVEQIKERLSIEEVASSYITLTRAGANFRAKCPFHNEKTPSFYISPDRGSYYCFGCGAKGDIFSFVEQFEGLDFLGALKILAERAGIPLVYQNREKQDQNEQLFAIMEDAAKFFTETIKNKPEILTYLKERGLTEDTIHSFRIGYVEDDWRRLYTYLREKKWSDVMIEKAGLAKKSEKPARPNENGHSGGGYYDRFRGRIMFPINDSSGRVIAFSGRTLKESENVPKYLNSPETPLFDKSRVLYGLDRAKAEIRKRNFAILVEGQFDLILSHQHGFTNTVATSGTALSDDVLGDDMRVTNLGLLQRLSSNLMLGFDGDKAGFSAALRGAKIALSLGMDVKVVKLPKGLDPADALRQDPKIWTEALKGAEHVILFHTNVLRERLPDDRLFARAVVKEVLPLVKGLQSEVERTHFIRTLGGRTGISEDALVQDLKKVASLAPDTSNESIGPAGAETKKAVEKDQLDKLFGILFWQEEQKAPLVDLVRYRQDLAEILGGEYDAREMAERERKDELVFEAEMIYRENDDIENQIAELIGRMKLRRKEMICEKLRHEIQRFEFEKKDPGELLAEYHKQLQEIESIKKTLLERE